jgi:hypothetical protein
MVINLAKIVGIIARVLSVSPILFAMRANAGIRTARGFKPELPAD